LIKLKTWEELTISDNFLFQNVMQDKTVCKHFIEKLLHIEVKDITYRQYEKTVELSPETKGVRFDIYVETDAGEFIDIEMQTSNKDDDWLPKRARYYGSMLDLSSLAKGKDYAELKNSYVIFVCTFDPFGLGRKLYSFRNTCKEANIELKDGAEKIFLNTKGSIGEVDEDIDNFLEYVEKNKIKGDFVENIASVVEKVKEHKELGVKYMSMLAELHDMRREGRMEGRREGEKIGEKRGEKRGIVISLKNLMKNMNLPLDKAMDVLQITGEDRKKYALLV